MYERNPREIDVGSSFARVRVIEVIRSFQSNIVAPAVETTTAFVEIYGTGVFH